MTGRGACGKKVQVWKGCEGKEGVRGRACIDQGGGGKIPCSESVVPGGGVGYGRVDGGKYGG